MEEGVFDDLKFNSIILRMLIIMSGSEDDVAELLDEQTSGIKM